MKEVISVVIPTKGRIREVCLCIKSILNQSFLPDEILVIDSSEKPTLGRILKEKFHSKKTEIKYIHLRASLTAARNFAIDNSLGDIIFFFDDDVVLDRDYIKEVMKIFRSDEDEIVGGVTGRIINVKRFDKSLRNFFRRLFFLGYFGDGKVLPSGNPTSVQGLNKITETNFLHGCSAAYRKKVFKHFRFDEKLGKLSGYCYMEDVDFSYRVSQRYKLIYTPFAKLEHLKSLSSRINIILANRQYIVNYFYLFRKNVPKHFLNVVAFYVSVFGLILRSLFRRNSRELIGILLGLKDAVFD
jgi:GT2 family glycosyltransferase